MDTIEIQNDLLDDVLIDVEKFDKVEAQSEIQKDEVLAIVLLYKNYNFKEFAKPYNAEICGKKMFEWVENALSDFETKTTTCDDNSNIVSLIKPLLSDKKTTIVLYSDTPLVSSNTISDALDYFNMRRLNVLKLSRGWIFNTEYIKNAETVSSVISREFGDDDFYPVYNAASLEFASSKLKNRILDFHLQNGVVIEDRASTFIDADVIIHSGVRIAPRNTLRGETFIAKNVVLETGNVIMDSIICAGCQIRNSYIKQSRISENMVVGPFEIIEGKES